MTVLAFRPVADPDARQRDRARVYLALSWLTASIRAEDFAAVLADVAETNARHSVGRGQGWREREHWRRLADALRAREL